MYSKTRNTLTALIAASLFAAAGWMFGHPIDSATFPIGMPSLQAPDTAAGLHDTNLRVAQTSGSMRARHANRMSLAMPYYSFAMLMPQRRAD
jgi:hypothetical protein